MAKKKAEGYLSGREARRIAKENRRITNAFEKQHKRKNVPESEYLTQMADPNNAVEFDNLHTYFYTDAGVVKSVDGVSFEVPIGKTVGRPLAATAGMGAATYICHTLLLRVTDAAPGTAVDKLITLAVIGIAVVAYGVLLLVLHAIDREDMLLLPKGEKISNILHLK